MSKRHKRKSRRRDISGKNIHHLLFQRKHWVTPYAKKLRTAMVREIPISVHNELHNEILHDVPKPSERLLEMAYHDYLEEKEIVDTLGICQLIAWLCDEIPDEAFQACMMVQFRFLSKRLSGY